MTEPYLGPQRGRIDVKKITEELEELYSKSLLEFKRVLKKDGRVVMIFPVFRATNKVYYITPDLNGFNIIDPIPEKIRKNKNIDLVPYVNTGLTRRNTIIYGRVGQKIWREVIILG